MLTSAGYECLPDKYHFSVENVQGFVAFLRDCGGRNLVTGKAMRKLLGAKNMKKALASSLQLSQRRRQRPAVAAPHCRRCARIHPVSTRRRTIPRRSAWLALVFKPALNLTFAY